MMFDTRTATHRQCTIATTHTPNLDSATLTTAATMAVTTKSIKESPIQI